jgi:predicted TIM-barrel fold metal-dependent hydrolase
VEEFRLLQKRIGTTRNIVVTPRAYVTDNRVTLDAIARLGAGARGVAVIHPTVTEAELKTLAEGGIRGIRFSITDPRNSSTSMEMIGPLSKRVNALGWHVQINLTADQIVAAEDLWNRLPSQIVFDHMGHVPQPADLSHPVFKLIQRLMDKGRTWVKLSVTYDNTKDGPQVMRISPEWRRPILEPLRSAWSGGVTGRTRMKRTSQTTQRCSI